MSTTQSTEIIDGTAIEEDHHGELVHVAAQPTTLFRTDDPVEVIERASKVADALKGVLTRQGLTTRISGKEHVRVEGWTTLGSMLGVVPVCAWSRPVEKGWEARVEARTLDGRVIGAAEAQCTRDEAMWKSRDDYALRSMAQTRATSKALRGPLGFILTLAGYDPTPAEEMPRDAGPTPAAAAPNVSLVTKAQAKKIGELRAGVPDDKLRMLMVSAGATSVSEDIAASLPLLTKAQADTLVAAMQEHVG